MSSFNELKGVIGYPTTPFDPYEPFEYVSKGPGTLRDTHISSFNGSKRVVGHPMTPFDPYKLL